MEAHQQIAAKELSDSTIRAELFYLHSVEEMEWSGLSEIAPAGAAIYHTWTYLYEMEKMRSM